MRTIKEIAEKTLEKIKASMEFKPEPPRYQLDATNHAPTELQSHMWSGKFQQVISSHKGIESHFSERNDISCIYQPQAKTSFDSIKVKLFLRQQGFGTLKLYKKFKGYL